MSASEKLVKYITKNGIKKKWFAQQLGISSSQFCQFYSGLVNVPKKHWVKLIEMTGGEVTFSDLLSDYLKPIEFIEVATTTSKNKCEVILKDLKKGKV